MSESDPAPERPEDPLAGIDLEEWEQSLEGDDTPREVPARVLRALLRAARTAQEREKDLEAFKGACGYWEDAGRRVQRRYDKLKREAEELAEKYGAMERERDAAIKRAEFEAKRAEGVSGLREERDRG